MRALVAKQYGPPDLFAIKDRPIPEPGPDNSRFGCAASISSAPRRRTRGRGIAAVASGVMAEYVVSTVGDYLAKRPMH
ncbi:hypothetical protein [Nonomuraea jabiensis]|uniref:hypothetical protein n=1 Tax=Nonomuraea jabiensis TaxID=882448 RepID=UPI003D741842